MSETDGIVFVTQFCIPLLDDSTKLTPEDECAESLEGDRVDTWGW